MKFIENEKARLQKYFDDFNANGSWMRMHEGSDKPLDFGLIDSYLITRVAPYFDAAGNVTRTDYWLLLKSAGYNNGWQYAHTIKVIGWSQDDTYLLDLTDDRDRRYHIELLFPTINIALVADWKRWQEYKAQNAAMFERIDAQILAEHIEIAETWS